MKPHEYASFIVVAIAAGLYGGILIAVASFYFQNGLNFCEPDTVYCAREWVGALSGWAAALAAGLTIFFIVGQTREAAKQTEFIVGDALPTATMFDPRETRPETAYSTRLDFINWNRNPVLIRRIWLEEPAKELVQLFQIEVEDHDAARKNVLKKELDRQRMFVPGWVDRTRSPTVAEFSLTFHSDHIDARNVAENGIIRAQLSVRIACTIASATPEDIELTARKGDALIVVD